MVTHVHTDYDEIRCPCYARPLASRSAILLRNATKQCGSCHACHDGDMKDKVSLPFGVVLYLRISIPTGNLVRCLDVSVWNRRTCIEVLYRCFIPTSCSSSVGTTHLRGRSKLKLLSLFSWRCPTLGLDHHKFV